MADRDADQPNFSVDLSNCDREPIHVLGTVQPFGFLIALTADWLVSRVSANSAQFIGLTPDDMLGKPIAALLDGEAIHALRNRITLLRGPDSVERLFFHSLDRRRPALRRGRPFLRSAGRGGGGTRQP